MSCSKSISYVLGDKKSNDLPHYFVELTESHLAVFEMLNSMCLLDDYDHLLFYLECQINETKILTIPPFDICLILMTLVTISGHYKEQFLRTSDTYNFTRETMNNRAIKILRFYLKVLRDFDTDKYQQYDLELLRCQFFLAIDTLIPKTLRKKFFRSKRMKVDTSRVLYVEKLEDDTISLGTIENPYRSYISCLEQKKTVIGNTLLTLKLSEPGEFINMILWTLLTSLQDDTALYTSCHDVWIPLLDILIDLFDLKHKYFLRNEIVRGISATLFVQRLTESPLALFFRSFGTTQFTARFCEYVFVNCSYNLEYDDDFKTEIHPVYRGENRLSNLYIPRMRYTKMYKIRKSLSLRRNIVGACLKLLVTVPNKHILTSPRIASDTLIDQICVTLAKFSDVDQFKSFFFTDSLSQELYFIPLLAEGTLAELFYNSGKLVKNLDEKQPLRFMENLSNVDNYLLYCADLFEKGFFMTESNQHITNVTLTEMRKTDVCLLVLLRYLLQFEMNHAIISLPAYGKLLDTIKINDTNRQQMLATHESKIKIPPLYPIVTQMSQN
ncbi:hypothetical protein NCAS_0H02730 [Naumovozyma castellii]|uniref:Uncharacterized protein n=1 Tax=Naumovozyma castellii TaxID=27288 RepID=G0VJA4_NAUCA|nr:hypothetical protein NCAS_0H02730 [Naumovozyma castellii CBS 4309]CCC71583.1 hypothetical protein NCAS_0H02730 [Naumovozyma castellii CBS 4309]